MEGEKGEDIEKYWEILKNGLVDILHEGKGEAKRMMGKKGKKGGRIEQIEKELRQLKEERRKVVERGERGEECANEMKKIKNKIERKRKARRGCVESENQ